MRLFQSSGLYPNYLPRLRSLVSDDASFDQQVTAFLNDRFGAPHILAPVLNGDPDAFFTNGDDPVLQGAWAREKGLRADATPEEILQAQIEEHRTEVFYNLDPIRFPSAFIRKLPSTVRVSVGWRAAPLSGADLSAYDLIVSNFPGILRSWKGLGFRTDTLFPAHDPVLDSYSHQTDREVDVLFVGGYSRLHGRRARILEAVASLASTYTVDYRLDSSRLTRLADSPLGMLGPLSRYRRPGVIRAVSRQPVFGRQLYALLGSAKIVINAAIDMAGEERGNMRCFEALGAGAALVSDRGVYPPGMEDGKTIVLYDDPVAARDKIEALLQKPAEREAVASAGRAMIASTYSKAAQMARFERLVD